MRYQDLLIAITVCFALSACGSGGSDTDSVTNADESSKCSPAVNLGDPTSKAAGLYTGTFNNDLGAIAQDAYALVAPNGKIAIASDNELATGIIDIDPSLPSVFNSTIDFWTSPTTNKRYPLASTSVDYRVGMTVSSGYSTMGDGWSSDFRYAIPNLPTCLESSTISDTWSSSDSSISITFEQNNSVASFTGSTASGCIISGQIKSYGIEGGIFSINATYENCSTSANNGDFSGLGALASFSLVRADTMLIVLSNLYSSKRYVLER